jgi:hypothetical protein
MTGHLLACTSTRVPSGTNHHAHGEVLAQIVVR